MKDRKNCRCGNDRQKWEPALQKIRKQRSEYRKRSKSEMEAYSKSITDELLQTSISKQQSNKTGPVRKCKSKQLIIRDKIVKCPDEAM